MRTKSFSVKKLLSLVLAIAMMTTIVLPTSVFAAITEPTAVATVVENTDGTQTKTITISFVEEVVLADDTALNTDISVAGKTFGESTMVLDSATQKDLVITLADDADVEVGETITFANDKIINASDNTDFFNGDLEITGSLECATIDYSGIVPADAAIEVTGYASAPALVGTGTFDYTLTKDNYVTKIGSFVVAQEDLGTTVTVSDTMEKKGADYTALDAAILSANTYNADNYTATSFAALTTAINNANAVDRNLKFDEQTTIDDLKTAIDAAISGLVSKRTVDFMAVGVTDDVNANYGKATKVVIVFDEPIDATASAVLDNLSIKDKVSSAVWADAENTVLSLVLNADANLANSTSVTYSASDDVKTKLMPAVVDTKTVVALGNFVGAADLVTATDMAATIVKGSDMPGVVNGDKIVIVFNAPVKDKPAYIEFGSLKAYPLTGTDNTVYQITLTGSESVDDSTTLTYGTMSTTLKGSFGTAIAPKAMKATAVDNDGTELVAGDQIVIKFNVPTNGAKDISKVIVKGNAYTATLGESTMDWDITKTILTITLASDAVIKDGVQIDLKNVGIKDCYGVVPAVESSLVMNVGGSFGYTVQPRITKAIAFSQNELDYIRVFFNTEVAKKGIIEPTLSGFTVEPGVMQNAKLIDEGNGLTYYEIVMGKDDHSAFTPGSCKISLVGIVDAETGTKTLSDTPVDIKGAFVTPIQPAVLKLVAISNDGSGIAKKGDKIIAIFNTEVSEGTITLLNGASFGDDYKTNLEENILEITLGENPTVAVGSQIRFSDFKDKATLSSTIESKDISVAGSFGEIIEPKILSATAISNDGSGIAKENDLIVLVFNTAVTGVRSELGTVSTENNIVWTIKLAANPNVVPGETVLTFDDVKSVAANAPIQDADKSIKLGGSFGYKAEANVKSVVLSEKSGKEIITVIFDRKTTKPALIGQTTFATNNGHLDVQSASWNDDGTVLTIGLGADATTTATVVDDLGNILSGTLDSNNEVIPGDVLNLSGLGIKSMDTNEDIAKLDKLAITGSLVPVATDVRFVGKKIQITFSARTNGVANISNLTALLGTGATADWDTYDKVLTITLGENYTITNNGYIVLNGMEIYDGFSGDYHVVGQYKVLGSIESDKLTVAKIVAQSTDKSKTTAQKGDTIVVKFNSATDLKGATLNQILAADKVDEIITIGDNNEAALGTGYTGEWTAYDTFVITLGGATTVTEGEGESATSTTTGNDPSITVGTTITVENVKFANGEGLMDAAPVELSGSFNGREFILTEGDITRTGANNTGDYRVAVKVEDTLLAPSIVPTVVCVAYNGTNPVSVMRISVDIENTIQPVFEFAEGLKITSAKIYVFNEIFGDINSSPSVLAETLEVK